MLISKEGKECTNDLKVKSYQMTNWQTSVSSYTTHEEKRSHYAATVVRKILLVSEYIYMKNHYPHRKLQK